MLAELSRHKSADSQSGEDLSKLLTDAHKARNRLMHSFFGEHNVRRDSNEGRAIMMADLQTIHESLNKAYEVASSPVKTDRS